MAIEQEIEQEINKQINAEIYSEYMYLAMSAYLESINLPGFSKWMKEQAKEEREHAMKLYNYLVERGGRVKLTQINEPQFEWNSCLEVFENALKHEESITSRINRLYEIATEKKDYPTKIMLQWFISEQVEEEASANEIVEKIKMIGESKGSLLMIDKHMGKRGLVK